MDYNTSRNMLILPEYGRNVQKMVEYAVLIEDKVERNKAIQEIVNIMGNANPHLRDIDDFKHKLWDQIAQMSKFEMEIDSPYPTPKKETFTAKPKLVPYTKGRLKYRYFGRIITKLIDAAIEEEDENKKSNLVKTIANHMKKLYIMWNKETVDDTVIIEKLGELSNGKLKVEKNAVLTDSKNIFGIRNRKRINHR